MIKPIAQPDNIVARMESLADPTRLRLLRVLQRHELGVVDLCDILQAPQSTVSRHLKVLSDQGWVRSERQGTTNLYRMILDELDTSARKLWLLAREETESWATTRQDQLRLDRLLARRQSDSQSFFAGKAAEWDKLRQELYGASFQIDAMLALLPSDYIIADLACGTGPLAVQLAPHVQRVIGVDNSSAMLKAARRRVGDLPNVDLRQGDLAALPIESHSCDAVLLLLALTYVPDPSAVLKEMARILKPQGRAVIVDLLPHDREDFRRQMDQLRLGFEPDELKNTMQGAGFVDIMIRPVPPEAGTKGPALFLATASVLRTND